MEKKIITFYSYKGGVGRTMALANAACQLANKHGLDVVAVDWDLEAPGLHYYFGYSDGDLNDSPGLLDYLSDFVGEVGKGPDGKVPDLKSYLLDLKPVIRNKIKNGRVRFLSCGRTNDKYMSRVQDFDWKEFYEKYEGYNIIETLKTQLLELSDVALVDARAGQADISTTSTIQMPDALLFLFTSNKQSLDGTNNIARKLKMHPYRINQGKKDLRMFFIPSRVFSEDDRFDKWIVDVANPIFNNLVKDGIVEAEDQPRGLQQCILGVEPRFTFKEELPVIDDSYIQSSLKSSYENLASAITDLLEGRTMWSSAGDVTFDIRFGEDKTPVISYLRTVDVDGDPQLEAENLKKALSSAAERGDDHRAAHFRYRLGQIYSSMGKFDEAEGLFQASLTYNRNRGILTAVSAIAFAIGALKVKIAQYGEAAKYFLEAVQVDSSLNNFSGQISALYQAGLANNLMDNPDTAIELFNKALSLSKKFKNPDDQPRILNGLAMAYHFKNQPIEASKLLKQCYTISVKTDNYSYASLAKFALAVVAFNNKKINEAFKYANECVLVAEQNDMPSNSILAKIMIGDIHKVRNEKQSAVEAYTAAELTAIQFEKYDTAADIELRIAKVLQALGKNEHALKLVKKAKLNAKKAGANGIFKKASKLESDLERLLKTPKKLSLKSKID